tara:strand:- start:688 stop:795 length:108 start_codon:yes stop_codon:yes gene_type:complete
MVEEKQLNSTGGSASPVRFNAAALTFEPKNTIQNV